MYFWHPTLSTEEIEHQLKFGKIKEINCLKKVLAETQENANFHNNVIKVKLDNNLPAILRLYQKNDYGRRSVYNEIAAYKASNWLESFQVPPIVIREYKNQIGTLQFFVVADEKLEEEKMSFRGLEKVNTFLDQEDYYHMMAFRFVFGQWDCTPHNQIFWRTPNGKIRVALIDNEHLGFWQYGEYGDHPFIWFGKEPLALDPNLSSSKSELSQQKNLAQLPLDQKKEVVQNILTRFFNKYDESSETEHVKNIKNLLLKDHYYAIWQQSLWIQIYKNTTDFPANFSPVCSSIILEKYENLNHKNLEVFFYEGIKHFPDFFHKNSFCFQAILNRRDQFLKYYQKNCLSKWITKF